ncbi:cation:proton antiporter [Svornostia abyssi]|uniref:Cation:proton antiporter n=1 Tax=Svornostia abyssi TaxID=2898438 RepID=A0ABY5PI74_9ACTN|nr:cation:proton antiporter [Parviterribacteraceae bacterium J379]
MPPLAAGSTPEFLPEIAALVVGGAVVAYVGLRLNIVPIVAFLLTGIVIGPNALGIVSDLEIVNAAAEVGVLLLLFTIGLEFSLDRLKELRRPLFLGGGLQVLLATLVTFLVLMAAGVDANVALFSGMLVSLSSTAIVLKLLADRGEVGSDHGRLAVSVLLFQDLAVVAMVLLVPVLGESGGSMWDIVRALGIAVAIIVAVMVFARRLLPPVLERVARTCSPELFLLTIVAICIGTAYGTSLAGVSVSLGAFLAGLVVSESRYSSQALGEILPLQIIFSATFFVSIGMLLDVGFLVDNLAMVLGAVVALLVVKALTAGAAVLALRERIGVAIATGLTLAQVGEFSFVLATAGALEGLTPAGLGADGTQGFIAATVLLMAATPALSAFGARVGDRMRPEEAVDTLVGRTEPVAGAPVAEGISDHVLIAGYGEWARGITRVLRDRDVPLVVTTLSPEGATDAHELGVPVLLGDPARIMTLNEAGIGRAKVVVIPDDGAERAAQVVGVVRALDPDMCVIVRARYAEDEGPLMAAGATHVVTEELAASALLLTKLFKAFGRELGDAFLEAKQVAQYHGRQAPPRAVRGTSNAAVDTEAPIEVELGPAACEHIGDHASVVPQTAGCEECLRIGDSWVHLRVCLTCGHVGCCDSSPNRHARMHHEREGHHVMRSIEPGESWVYCFADDRTLLERSGEDTAAPTRTR